jgi:DNA polymerase-1
MADLPALKGSLGIHYHDYAGYHDTMLAHGVLWPDYPHSFEFCQSLYGQYHKVKQLKRKGMTRDEEETYNEGDTVELEHIWAALQREFSANPGPAQVYREQLLPLVPLILESMEHGIRVDLGAMQPLYQAYSEQQNQAQAVAHCAAQIPLNLASSAQLQTWAYDICGNKAKKNRKTKQRTLDKAVLVDLRQKAVWFDAEEEDREGLTVEQVLERVEQGSSAVLEARALYQQAEASLKYLEAMKEGRIYPDFQLHAQASGRWSTNDPPVAQFFEEIEDLLHPEEGEWLVEWDWSQLEPRILAHLSNDTPTIQAFERGEDVYKVSTLDAFGRTTDQLRRFTKSVIVLRSNYGGDPAAAGKHPAARVLGLPEAEITRAAQAYNNAHPAKTAYWNQVLRQIQREGKTHTIGGRHRIAHQQGDATNRELFNNIMQGSVSDVLNLTLLAIKKRCPRARLLWTKHDSAKWAVRDEDLDTYYPLMIQEVTEREWQVGAFTVKFPAKFKVRR